MKQILFANESYRAWFWSKDLATFNSGEIVLTVQYFNGENWVKVERYRVAKAFQVGLFERINDCYNA